MLGNHKGQNMKFNKLVSITLCNSFVLLVFASMLASCQKSKFAKVGLFSKWESTPSRSIASVPKIFKKKHQVTFINFQDPKQILIFCHSSSTKVKTCYKDHFNKTLVQFTKSYGPFSAEKIISLKEQFTYELVSETLNTLVSKVLEKTNDKMKKIVMSRKTFCEKNSEYFLKKCLSQYLEKDTFSVLNQFHGKNRMNGQEYLYIKSKIKHNLNKKFIEAKIKIEKNKMNI